MNYTQEEVDKLLNYLEEKAEELAKNGEISDAAYYPGRTELADYRWLIIYVVGLGDVRLYYTSASNLIKVNNVLVDRRLVKYDRLANVFFKLQNELDKYKAEKSKSWFKDK